ncbi:unnamed protein product [Trifolium pratense]|uniref:Uncharacterized protein n=1 Tax=Trifolium pratense TaxID=57577 RepID=A0ACB0J1P7_TRIPR|nr:unnamed protein product [Trifolium pratense]
MGSPIVISHGFDAEDVKKLKDARIVTCNDLMMHTEKNFKDLTKDKVDQIREAVEKLGDFLKTFVNLPGIEVLHEAKADQIREAAEELVNLGRVNGPKFNQICEAAKKLLDYLKTFVVSDCNIFLL